MNQSKLEERLKKIDMLFKAKKLDIEASKPLETIQAKPINFEEEKKPEMLPAVQPVKQDQKYIIKPNPDHNIPSVSKKIQKPKSADPKEIRDQKKKEQLQAFIKKRDEERKCRTLRKCGGVIWQDDTIDDWPENDFRIFCGDLGNEVTDELSIHKQFDLNKKVLATAFRRYTSFHRCKVIRDKRSGKTKGFGFVSLLDPQDFLKAMNEMQGKYVGNRPVKIRKSTWQDRDLGKGKSIAFAQFKKNKNKK